jgi:hypothetical protein
LRKRLLIIGVTLGALFVGLAGFAANTAEWVNVVAHVEKEIAVACVESGAGETGWVVTPAQPNAVIPTGRGDCNYGTVFPQERGLIKVVEVAASQSFLAQDRVLTVNYDVLWECKLPDPSRLYDGTGPAFDANGDGILERNICREQIENVNNPLRLDGNIRDHVTIRAEDGCLLQGPFDIPQIPEGGPAEIDNLGRGQVGVENEKCFYGLVFNVPACAGHLNPNTDPDPDPRVIRCNEATTSPDPQLWDISADLGDDFKIQVVGFEYAPTNNE